MCKTEIFTFTACEHRVPSHEVEKCAAVRLCGQLPCEPITAEEVVLGEKCHDCVEADNRHAESTQEADEEAELQRILEESLQHFEQEAGGATGVSAEEQEMLDRALRESAEMQSQAPDTSDEDELQRILALSLEAHEAEASKPKHYLRQKLRYECGHESDMGATDIEFDPMADGLPYILHDEKGDCPDCGGSSSRAISGRRMGADEPLVGNYTTPAESRSSAPVANEFSGFDDDEDNSDGENLINLDPHGKMPATALRPRSPPPGLGFPTEEESATNNDGVPTTTNTSSMSTAPVWSTGVDLLSGDNGTVPSDSAHPSSSAIREQRDLASTQQNTSSQIPSTHPPSFEEAQQNGRGHEEDDDDDIYSSSMSSSTSSLPFENPPYATVDNLALEGLMGEQRAAKEREERERVQRLREEGSSARPDADSER